MIIKVFGKRDYALTTIKTISVLLFGVNMSYLYNISIRRTKFENGHESLAHSIIWHDHEHDERPLQQEQAVDHDDDAHAGAQAARGHPDGEEALPLVVG